MVLLLVSEAITADARQRVLAPAGLPGDVDGVLNASVAQPPGVAPVQLPLPRVVQLVVGRHRGVLVSARPLRIVEVQVVAAKPREVGKDDAYGSDRKRNGTYFKFLGQVFLKRTFILPFRSRVTTAVPSSKPSMTSHLYFP